MARITHFDLAVEDPERAEHFYSHIFDWKVEKWDGPMDYWMITTGKDSERGINGGFIRKADADGMPVQTISVHDLDATIEMIKSHGGKIVTEKRAIPGVGWFAGFRDPEGNVLGIMQEDENAK